MPASKIQDRAEVLRWFEEGRTYAWMIEEYRRKYNIETVHSMWANFRRRYGLDRRIVRDGDLIPWRVLPEHRHAYPLRMLRQEARRRAGEALTEEGERALDAWLERLERENAVVYYKPDAPDGFYYVTPKPGHEFDEQGRRALIYPPAPNIERKRIAS